MLKLSERFEVTKPGLLRMLGELGEAGWCRRTVHLTQSSVEALSQRTPGVDSYDEGISTVLKATGTWKTGLGLFLGDRYAVAIDPPFPIISDLKSDGADTSHITYLLKAELCIGIILLRLGRYSVGVVQGDRLVTSKIGSRYVKNRHRAGGSSQRRFERSRERLVRELFDEVCRTTQEVIGPFNGDLDYILMGGEHHTLEAFTRRCKYISNLDTKVLGRRLYVNRPGRAALDGITSQVWKSRVVTFEAP